MGLGLGLSLGLTRLGGGGTRLLSGDAGAAPEFQATYSSAFYRLNGASAQLGGTYTRTGNAWDRRGRKYAADTLRRTSSGVLIEKSQQNYATVVSGSSMFNVDTNVTRATGALAPDGETNACSVTSTATSGLSARNTTVTGSTTDPHRVALFAPKATTSTEMGLTLLLTGGTGVTVGTAVNRLTGTPRSGPGHVTDCGDYWCVEVPITQNGTANTTLVTRFTPVSGGTGQSDAWALNVYRNESLFSSPIVATATRSADNFTHTTASLGVDANAAASYVVEWSEARIPPSGTKAFIACLDDGTANNRIALYLNDTGFVTLEVTAGGVQQCLIARTGITNWRGGRAAFAIAGNDVALYVDGVQIGTDTSVTLPTGIATWRHGHDHTPANHLNGLIVEEGAFASRQTNETLATLSGRSAGAALRAEKAKLAAFFSGGVSGKTVSIIGNSRVSGATELFNVLNQHFGGAGMPLNGVTFNNRGENGATIQAFIAGSVTHNLAAVVAEAPDLYVIHGYLSNDVRQGARSQAQCIANLTTVIDYIRTNDAGKPIVLWGEGSFLSTDVGNLNYVSPETAEAAQAYSDILYNAVESFRGVYSDVAVIQEQGLQHGGAVISPRTVVATSTWMSDQLHENSAGQREKGRQLGEFLSP